MKNIKYIRVLVAVLIGLLLLMLAGCSLSGNISESPTEIASPPERSEQPSPVAVEPTPTEEPAPTSDLPEPTDLQEPTDIPPTEIPEATQLPENILPPEPQLIEFESEDGFVLNGTYYPASVNPAPAIVLMHWAPGDQTDWVEIAYWLQNRGLIGNPIPAIPWLDPSWFPEMFADHSFAVFTFNFRYCENGCGIYDPDGWLMDAQAAMRTVRELDGIDPMQIAAIGASIGSDGAADGCFWYNDQYDNGCLGALSLSPGSYLSVPYTDAVITLDAQTPPKSAWCFYAVADAVSSITCQSAAGVFYKTTEWEGSLHGMELIDPDLDPNAMKLMLDFLQLTFGIEE